MVKSQSSVENPAMMPLATCNLQSQRVAAWHFASAGLAAQLAAVQRFNIS